MKSSEAFFKIENSLNKLSSSDYQNIGKEQMQEAVNSAVLKICREKIPYKESTTAKVDDLQVLLAAPKRMSGTDKGIYFLSSKLPSDYFGYSRVTPICSKGECTSVSIPSILIEDANVDTYLSDWSEQPSFDFEQSFHTLNANRIRIYHNKDFEVKEIELSYYRNPQYIEFPGAYKPDGNQGKDMEWEFKKDMCEVIIDEAVRILAGNIENPSAYQVKTQQLQEEK